MMVLGKSCLCPGIGRQACFLSMLLCFPYFLLFPPPIGFIISRKNGTDNDICHNFQSENLQRKSTPSWPPELFQASSLCLLHALPIQASKFKEQTKNKNSSLVSFTTLPFLTKFNSLDKSKNSMFPTSKYFSLSRNENVCFHRLGGPPGQSVIVCSVFSTAAQYKLHLAISGFYIFSSVAVSISGSVSFYFH